MANKKISALPSAGGLDGSELLPVVQSGVTAKTTAQAIADLFSGGGVKLDEILAATGANTINNANNAQVWSWNTLGNAIGLSLTSSSTAAAGNGQTLFKSTLTGANATATQTTYAGLFVNQHTGTASTNVALYANATGGTNNYAGLFTGNIGANTLTPTAYFHVGAGTAAAGTAPIKFTSGTNLTTPEAGALEWDGTNLFITQTSGPTRKALGFAATSGSATTANGTAIDLGGSATGDIEISLATHAFQIDTNASKSTGIVINNANDGVTTIGDITGNLNNINFSVDSVNDLITIDNTGHNVKTGINTLAPTAQLHVAAGTATAGTAPIKLTTGTNLTVAAAGALEYTTPQLFFTNGGGQRQEIPQIQQSRVVTQLNVTSSVTPVAITGLSATVVAGKTYRFEAKLYNTTDAGGSRTTISGTATATAIIYNTTQYTTGTINVGAQSTALNAEIAANSNGVGFIDIVGTITVNAGGTLVPKFAQSSSNPVASSIKVGSTFVVTEIA